MTIRLKEDGSFSIYDAYLELWNVLDNRFDDDLNKANEQENSYISSTHNNGEHVYASSKTVETPVLHPLNLITQTPQYNEQISDESTLKSSNVQGGSQSIIIGFFGCVILLFLIVQLILYAKHRFIKKNSWSISSTPTRTIIAAPMVKKDDATIWSAATNSGSSMFRTGPYHSTGAFTSFTPHTFQSPSYCTIPGSLNFYANVSNRMVGSSNSSSFSSGGSLSIDNERYAHRWSRYGKMTKSGFQETTVFMVDPRGHFTPRLTTSPELLNVSDASTPSYESCATCTARNNSNNLDVPPHLHYPTLSSLVFDRERNVVLPSHQIANNPNAQVTPNNSLQNSTSVSRCEGCGASFNSSFSNRAIDNSMTSATSSSGDSSLRHYKAGVSLLPVTSQMDLPMSLVDKSSLTTVSGLSRTSPQLDKQEDIHLCV